MVLRRGKPNFTEGPIFTRLLLFTLPIIATSLLAVLYHMADNIVVGQFSGDDSALAAVGQTASYSSLLSNLIIGISIGSGVVVAQLFGAGRKNELRRAIHTSMTLSVIMGVILMVVGLIVSRPVLSLIIAENNHAILLDKATLYMQVISIGLPAASIYNFGAANLRSLGDSRTPLIIGALSGLINVGLNLVFVIVFRMSVVGVATATVISQYASAIAVVVIMMRSSDESARLDITNIGVDVGMLTRILVMGIPAALQSAVFSLANMMLASAVGTLPVETISANTIAGNIDSITYQCMNGFASSVTTFAGQNFGAMKRDRIWRSFAAAVIQVTVIGILVSALELIFADQLCSLFVAADQAGRDIVIAEAKRVMLVILTLYFICGIMGVFGGFLRGLGFSISPMLASVFSVLVVRITWIYVFFPIHPDSIVWLYLCFPITWILTLLIEAVIILFAARKLRRLEAAAMNDNKNLEAEA